MLRVQLRQLRVIVQELEDKRKHKVHLTTPRPFTALDNWVFLN